MKITLIRATHAHDFFSYNPDRDCLFSVRAGVPAKDVLEMASGFLDAARSTVCQLEVHDESGPTAYAVEYLITQAKALIDALSLGASGEDCSDKRFADVLERVWRLFDEGACIVNPNANKVAARDTGNFLAWVDAQRKGGAA